MPQQDLWLSPAHPSVIFGPNSCPAVSPWCHLRSLVSVAVQENCPALCSVVLSGTSKFKKGSDNKKCSVLITGVLGREGGLAVTLPSQQRAVLSLQPPNSRPPSREIDYTAYPW